MEAHEIHYGRSYWAMHEGHEIKVAILWTDRVANRWLCKREPDKLYLRLPLSAFVRAIAPS
jgi:hypothetical protein